MPTCAAPMHTDIADVEFSRARIGFTLIELMVVVMMVMLLVLLPQMNLLPALARNRFRARAQKFVSVMQMAATSAAQSDRRYEVIVDLAEQMYTLREITNPDLSQVLEEEIIVEEDFGESCTVTEILFDDGDYTNEGRAKFRAGRAGWQYGGKVLLVDDEGRIYSVVVNLLDRAVQLVSGDAQLLTPKFKEDVPF